MLTTGWVKWEKSVESDPRTSRIVRHLVTHERYTTEHAVTLVCGALVRLWSYMDTHGREDDTLDLSPAEVDAYVGIPGFASMLPDSWLVATEDGRVELPNFHEHNSAEAKKKALGAKRVAKHRARQRADESRDSVTPCNAPALPDQTRPDPSISIQGEARPAAKDAPDDPEGLARIRAAYPKFAGRQDWIRVAHFTSLRIAEGSTWNDLVDAVTRYAAYVRATGREGTSFVLQPVTFFSAPDRPWTQPWEAPKPAAAPARGPQKPEKTQRQLDEERELARRAEASRAQFVAGAPAAVTELAAKLRTGGQ